MTKKLARSAAAAPNRLALFGSPPLLEGEDSAAYDDLLARVSGAVKPADVLEEIWVCDIVDLIWETFRWRRLKVNLMAAATHEGVQAVLEPMVGYVAAHSFAEQWARREADAIKEVNEQLASANLSMDAVMAQALAGKLNEIERIDRMTMNAEVRRNAILREVDRHRASLGQALRRASDEVEDAQFEEIKAPQITDRKAA